MTSHFSRFYFNYYQDWENSSRVAIYPELVKLGRILFTLNLLHYLLIGSETFNLNIPNKVSSGPYSGNYIDLCNLNLS